MRVEIKGNMIIQSHPGDAGWDIRSSEDVGLMPGCTRIIKTGTWMAIEEGYEAQVRSRSGMASKGIIVTNSPGTIDAGYRGEVGVILTNLTDFYYEIKKGDRIAQIVFAPVIKPSIEQVFELNETVRGEGGFGSTGIQ